MPDTRKRRTWYAAAECEGEACSVGPFESAEDADLFRSLMFAGEYGTTTRRPTGQRMTVARFQSAFRADFVGEPPPARWFA